VVLLVKNILREILEKDQRLNKLFRLELAQELNINKKNPIDK
jgi:hypothetical protein